MTAADKPVKRRMLQAIPRHHPLENVIMLRLLWDGNDIVKLKTKEA
jgi:hypothetical protein